MRFVRGTRLGLATILFLAAGIYPSKAIDTPALTWERGKTQNIVLGGFAKDLDLEILLVSSRNEPLSLTRSQSNSSGFVVLTINLPKDLPLGQYRVISKENSQENLLAAVQIVDRFQYSILEVPRDLIFVSIFTFLILLMQLTIRSWNKVRVSEESNAVPSQSHSTILDRVLSGLLLQRMRWKERFLGFDYSIHPFAIPWKISAVLPLLSILLISFASLGRFWDGSLFQSSIVVLTAISVIGVLDQYSAKLATLLGFTLFILLSGSLNLPSVLNLIMILSMFLLPRYVGELTFQFCTLNLGMVHRKKELAIGLSSLVAGASIFYLYLLSESVVLGAKTDASMVTPVAIAVGIVNVAVASKASKLESNQSSTFTSERYYFSVISIPNITLLFLMAFTTFAIWTGSFLIAASLAVLWFGGLFGIHFVRSSSLTFTRLWLRDPRNLLLGSIFTLASITLVLRRMPLVVQDQSKLFLISLGVVIFAISIFSLLTSSPLIKTKDLDTNISNEGLR